MKHYRISLVLTLLFAMLIAACGTTSKNDRLLVGRWFSIGWLRNGIETDIKAWFEFNEDHSYRAVIGSNKEEGTWHVEGYKLFTQAAGEERIVVKITKLDNGNLELEMNRSGQKENLIFTRANYKSLPSNE